MNSRLKVKIITENKRWIAFHVKQGRREKKLKFPMGGPIITTMHLEEYNQRPAPCSGTGLIGVLGDIGERMAAGNGSLEQVLEEMARGLRETLGVGGVSIKAMIRGTKEVRVREGGVESGGEVVFPISSGYASSGRLSVFPKAGERLDEAQAAGLRAAASVAALAVSNAAAREIVIAQKVNLSAVQLASEALGAVLDEERLYSTVLLLTLELLSSTAGVVLPGERAATAVGFDGRDAALRALERRELDGRKAWLGRVEGGGAIGARIGSSGGSIFLFREGDEYTAEEGDTLKLIARQLARAQERSQLHNDLENNTIEMTESLASALESRDGTTGAHISRSQELAESLARELGLAPPEVRSARFAAVLHDIGKIGVPDAILNKPGKLDEWEWEVMRRHPEIGGRILAGISGFEQVAAAVVAHHERFDGGGYPRGLAGEDIPVEARIIAAVDAYDAMTNDRPYRKAMSHEAAVGELGKGAGKQFDPAVVNALTQLLDEENKSTIEEMSNEG